MMVFDYQMVSLMNYHELKKICQSFSGLLNRFELNMETEYHTRCTMFISILSTPIHYPEPKVYRCRLIVLDITKFVVQM